MTKVSIIIPSYKRAEYLKISIESVLRQTLDDWELLVIDDNGEGTPDQLATAKVIKRFGGNPKINYIIHKKNKGGAAARNTGISAAKGDYICFLDNDDEFYPEKLACQIEALQNEKYSAVVCRFDSYKNNKKVRVSPVIPPMDEMLVPFAQGKINLASGSTLMIERTLLDEIGRFDEDFGRKQDVELMIRILEKNPVKTLNEVLVRLNIEDRTNIPSIENFRKFQKMFQEKFENIFSKLSASERIGILQYDQIELAKVALWNKDPKEFLKVLAKSDLSFTQKMDLIIDLSKKFITYFVK
jgi:glycosyltransferase involved in cell wall biosynthesis